MSWLRSNQYFVLADGFKENDQFLNLVKVFKFYLNELIVI